MLGTFNLPVNIMDPQQIQVGLLCDLLRESQIKLAADYTSLDGRKKVCLAC